MYGNPRHGMIDPDVPSGYDFLKPVAWDWAHLLAMKSASLQTYTETLCDTKAITSRGTMGTSQWRHRKESTFETHYNILQSVCSIPLHFMKIRRFNQDVDNRIVDEPTWQHSIEKRVCFNF